MKKKKKRNYYNLIMYFFKFSLIMIVIIMIPIGYANFKPIPKFWEYFLAIIFFLNLGLLMLSWYLMGKFESKITIDLDGPCKPYDYDLEVSDLSQVFNKMKYRLQEMKYEENQREDIDSSIYVRHQKNRNIGYPNYDSYLFGFYEFEEFNKQTLKYMKEQRKQIGNQFKEKCNSVRIILIIKVKNMNEYLKSYLPKRTEQYFYRYILVAFLVESDNKLYIPRANMWPGVHWKMKKEVKKALQDYLKN